MGLYRPPNENLTDRPRVKVGSGGGGGGPPPPPPPWIRHCPLTLMSGRGRGIDVKLCEIGPEEGNVEMEAGWRQYYAPRRGPMPCLYWDKISFGVREQTLLVLPRS